MRKTILKSLRLSTGQLLEFYKHGRTYTVLLCGLELHEAPSVHSGLCKSEAEKVFADYLQADVLETN